MSRKCSPFSRGAFAMSNTCCPWTLSSVPPFSCSPFSRGAFDVLPPWSARQHLLPVLRLRLVVEPSGPFVKIAARVALNARRRRSSSSMCPTNFCPRRFCERHFRRSSTSHVTLGVPWQSTTSFQQRGICASARRKKVNARSSVCR